MHHDTAEGTCDFLRWLVRHPGSAYLRPDGNSLYAAKRAWVKSVKIACAFVGALALYENERSLRLVPVILLHTRTMLSNLILLLRENDPFKQIKESDLIKQDEKILIKQLSTLKLFSFRFKCICWWALCIWYRCWHQKSARYQ